MKVSKVKLGEVCELVYGKSLKKENRVETGSYPVFGSSGVVGYHNEYLSEGSTIIVGRKGSIGTVYYSDVPCWTIDTAYFIRPTDRLHPRYLYYQLRTLRLNELDKSAAIPGLSRTDAYDKMIAIPYLNIQKQIADTLDKADALRQKDQQLLQKYDELAQSIFYDMFGDPVRNERGWSRKKLSDCVTGKYGIKAGPFGSSLKKEYYVPSGYKIYGQEQVIADDLDFGDYYINEEKYRELESCKVNAGDVLISMVGTFGKVSVVPKHFQPGIINPRLVKLTFNKEMIDPYFFKFFFQLPEAKKALSSVSRGGTMDIINAGILKELEVITPPIQTQRVFVENLNYVTRSQMLVSSKKSNVLFDALINQSFK